MSKVVHQSRDVNGESRRPEQILRDDDETFGCSSSSRSSEHAEHTQNDRVHETRTAADACMLDIFFPGKCRYFRNLESGDGVGIRLKEKEKGKKR